MLLKKCPDPDRVPLVLTVSHIGLHGNIQLVLIGSKFSETLFVTDGKGDDGGGWSLLGGSAGMLSARPSFWTEPSPPMTGSRPGLLDLRSEHPPGRGENISGPPSCGTEDNSHLFMECITASASKYEFFKDFYSFNGILIKCSSHMR